MDDKAVNKAMENTSRLLHASERQEGALYKPSVYGDDGVRYTWDYLSSFFKPLPPLPLLALVDKKPPPCSVALHAHACLSFFHLQNSALTQVLNTEV